MVKMRWRESRLKVRIHFMIMVDPSWNVLAVAKREMGTLIHMEDELSVSSDVIIGA